MSASERALIWIVRPASERERERDASARLDDLPVLPRPLPSSDSHDRRCCPGCTSPPNPVWVRRDFIFFELLELEILELLEDKKDKFARFEGLVAELTRAVMTAAPPRGGGSPPRSRGTGPSIPSPRTATGRINNKLLAQVGLAGFSSTLAERRRRCLEGCRSWRGLWHGTSGKGWGPQSVMEKGKQLLGGGASGGGWRSKIPSLVKLPKLGSGADLRQAMSEKVLSFWQQNRHIIIGAAFSVAVYYVWRTTYGIASMFIDLTETFAELGFLALAVALAGAGCLWIRERARINPDKLFRLAMTRLNTSPSVLGVMGAPLTGSHLQVSPRDGRDPTPRENAWKRSPHGL